MFKIESTGNNIELQLGTSEEEHIRTGCKIIRFTEVFTFDEWIQFADKVNLIVERIKPSKEPELRGRADQIHDTLEELGPLTYNELAEQLGLTYKRVARLVSQMVRDGVKLTREGKPRKVNIVK